MSGFVATSSVSSPKLVSPAAERNSGPILSVLKQIFKDGTGGLVLEIASGSGYHASLFASHFPNFTWQSSDCDDKHLDSIRAYVDEAKLPNFKAPCFIDVSKPVSSWNCPGVAEGSVDVIFNVNMMHITPLECTHGLFSSAGKLLNSTGKLIVYGPFAVNGVLSPESNVAFDRNLRSWNPSWGVRDVALLETLAAENGLALKETFDMPSNNKTLLFVKSGS